jgi:hypothetical protein
LSFRDALATTEGVTDAPGFATAAGGEDANAAAGTATAIAAIANFARR